MGNLLLLLTRGIPGTLPASRVAVHIMSELYPCDDYRSEKLNLGDGEKQRGYLKHEQGHVRGRLAAAGANKGLRDTYNSIQGISDLQYSVLRR